MKYEKKTNLLIKFVPLTVFIFLIFSINVKALENEIKNQIDLIKKTSEIDWEGLDANIQKKLVAQFKKYDSAREKLIENFSKKNPVDFTRDKWESIVNISFTPAEIKKLREFQHLRIQRAKSKAKKMSIIDLNKFRKNPSTLTKFCQEIPKGGMLHVHLSGSNNLTTIEKLLKKSNPTVPLEKLAGSLRKAGSNKDADFLESIGKEMKYSDIPSSKKNKFIDLFALSEGTHSFPRFDVVFEFIRIIKPKGQWENTFEMYWDFAKRAKKLGVTYVEFSDTGIFKQTEIKNYNQVVKKYKDQFGIVVVFKKSFKRFRSPEALRKKFLEFDSLPSYPWLVGIDFLANEENASALYKGQFIYGKLSAKARKGKTNLKMTMHSGELGDLRNPRDSIILGASRLGHGVRLWKDPVSLEYAIKKKLAIEINLKSNLMLKVVKNMKEHPFMKFQRSGISTSLSTDDEGFFRTDMANECKIAITQSDISYYELKKMYLNSLKDGFVSHSIKKGLLVNLKNKFKKFEKTYQ